MDLGVRLGEQQIHKISGPSTYAILLPPKESNLPIQFLFGDIHRSFNNACKDDEKHTYNIYGEEFLSLLDKVAKIYPIHFYTESAYGKFIEKIEKVEDGYLFSRLVRNMKNCYANREVYSYEEECSTRHIKWEHVDARFFENSTEGYAVQYIREFLRKQISQKTLFKNWISFFEDNISFTRDIEIWPSGLGLSIMIINLIVKYVETCPRKKDYIELSAEFNSEIDLLFKILAGKYTTDERYKAGIRIIDIVNEESGINNHYRNLLYDIMNYYFNSLSKDGSSTARQLNKLQVRSGSDISKLKEQLKFLPELSFDKLKFSLNGLFSVDINVLKTIQKLIEVPPRAREKEYYSGIKFEKIDALTDGCEKLLRFLDSIFCSFLDIFYIIRMLQAKNSYLSIGYFGDYHTQNIIEFFTKNLNYTVLAKSDLVGFDPEYVSRCITLDNIDLDDLLKQYITRARKSNIIEHIKKLNKEQQKRYDSLPRKEFIKKFLSNEIKSPLEVPMWIETLKLPQDSP